MAEKARGMPADDRLARAVEAIAVLLDAGIPPLSVWAYASEEADHPAIARAARSIAAGVPPSEALVDAAGHPAPGRRHGTPPRLRRGRERAVVVDHGVAAVAAAWTMAEQAGAALSPALRGAATALRDRAESGRDVSTALAGPRATARLMAWLPLVGVAMAYMIGIDVVGTLAGGPLGWGVAVAGAALMAAGRGWTTRLVREASRAGPVAGTTHDLMTIALAGGMPAAGARRVVAAVRQRMGLSPAGGDDSSVERVLRIAERAGAPAVELLAAEARQERRGARSEGRRRAEVLAVRLLLPLGLCVLPAFVLLGVVPVILAMLSSTVTGLT